MKRTMDFGVPVIRMIRMNKCSNRPCYRIVLQRNLLTDEDPYIEDLGSYDPLPNRNNEIIFALNFERIKYHLGNRVPIKGYVSELLGK